MTNKEIIEFLNPLSLRQKLLFIKEHPELTLGHDNGWFWVERNGEVLETEEVGLKGCGITRQFCQNKFPNQ